MPQPAHATTAVPPTNASRAVRAESSFAFADFDGDRQPDLATAEIEHSDSHLTRYLIRLRLQASDTDAGQSIGVTGSFGLPQISAMDVNGDHVPDLVVTASGQPKPIAILLNDGRGRFAVANPSDFASVTTSAPSHWSPPDGHLIDIAVLVLARSPLADSANHSRHFAPRLLTAAKIPTNPETVPDSLRSIPLGRAPPHSL